MADSNTVALRYYIETAWDTPPSPIPALKPIRRTADTLNEMETATESAEIITDRQLRDSIRTGRGSEGGVDFELSYGSFDDLLELGLADAWVSNVLENGTTRGSILLEKQVTAADATEHFLRYGGFRIGTLSLSMSLGSVITGSFGGVGKGMAAGATSISSTTPAAATTTLPVSVVDLSAVKENNIAFPGATEFTLNIDNNLRRQDQLGSVDPYGIGYGGFRVTGTIAGYFRDRALIDKYIARTATSFEVEVTDGAGNKYTFLVPRARLGAPDTSTPGVNQDQMATFPFTGIVDAGSTEKSLIISRTPA